MPETELTFERNPRTNSGYDVRGTRLEVTCLSLTARCLQAAQLNGFHNIVVDPTPKGNQIYAHVVSTDIEVLRTVFFQSYTATAAQGNPLEEPQFLRQFKENVRNEVHKLQELRAPKSTRRYKRRGT